MGICDHCGLKPVSGCNGFGKIVVDEVTHRRCPNKAVLDMKRYLVQGFGEKILSVPHARQSPLLELGGRGEPEIKEDLTQRNVHIHCTWYGLLPHLKWTFSYKWGKNFLYRVVTDERLKSVFVGNEGYKARKLQEDLERGLFNSLDDLVGSTVDLAIIKLGYLGYKNAAGPGCLKEALLLRQNLGRPTWLIEDPTRPWVHSRDPDVVTYIEEHFEDLVLESEEDIEGRVIPQETRPEDEAYEDDEVKAIERNFNEEPDEEPDDEPDAEPDAEPAGILELELPGENKKKKGWRK